MYQIAVGATHFNGSQWEVNYGTNQRDVMTFSNGAAIDPARDVLFA